MEYKISVIVPVYNCKNYLHRAVDSVISQSCFNVTELILVDDGSTDGSSEICDSYGKVHPNIKVIHQQNSGVSAARNSGIEASEGEWICFLDSDDYYLEDSFNLFLNCPDANFICAGYQSNSTVDLRIFNRFSNGLYGIDSISNELNLILASNNSFYTCWAKLFKRSIIEENSVRFPEGLKVAEDMVFVYTYLLYCKNLFLLDKPVYYYYVNESNTSSVVLRSFDTLFFVYNWKTDYFKRKCCYTDEIKELLNKAFIWRSFFSIKTSATYMKYKDADAYLKEVLANELFYKLYLDADFNDFSTLTDKLLDRYIRKRNSLAICLIFKINHFKTKLLSVLQR